MDEITEELRLPRRWRQLLILAASLPAIVLVVLWLSATVPTLYLFGAFLVLLPALMVCWIAVWSDHVSVNAKGMNLYRGLYRFAWEDVSVAKRTAHFGLRYIRVERFGRLPVLIPLTYVQGSRTMADVLRHWLPKGNPIERCLADDA